MRTVTQHSPQAAEGVRTLHSRDFSFHGFDVPQVANRVAEAVEREIEIHSGEPRVSIVEGAVFVPDPPRKGGQGTCGLVGSQAGVPDADLDEEVVYLGWLFPNHFGHFLTESLARTWFLEQLDPSVRVVFHHKGRAQRPPEGWALRILELFGVPRDRILVLDAPTRVRRMFVPEPLFAPRSTAQDHKVRAHQEMIRPYRTVASRIADAVKSSEQPVYLSRRLLSSGQRPIVGESELEGVLRENGFRIAHPQRMTIEDQIKLVNEHTDIFSSTGSAAHNVLFALQSPRLHLLTNEDRFSPNFFLFSAIAGAPTTFVNCLGRGGRPRLSGAPKYTPQLVQTPKIVEYLDACGLLATRPALSAGREPALQDQYDEAWLYAQVAIAMNKRGETLQREIEREALSLAAWSWPVSLALAGYYARRHVTRVDSMAKQFAELAAAEVDLDRLAHYRADVDGEVSTVVKRCDPATAVQVAAVVSDRFLGRSLDSDAVS
jgi:hypothetical protein